jgi:antitoxin ChpS
MIMYITHLRKVGGSLMLAVPPSILNILHLQAGATVGFSVEGNRLIIESQPRPRYTLDELLSQCDASQPLSIEDRQWVDAEGQVGRELL